MESFVKRYFWINEPADAGGDRISGGARDQQSPRRADREPRDEHHQRRKRRESAKGRPASGEWAELIVDRNIFAQTSPKSDEPDGGAGGDGRENVTPMPSQRVSMIARRAMRQCGSARLSWQNRLNGHWPPSRKRKERLARVGVMVGDHELVAIRQAGLSSPKVPSTSVSRSGAVRAARQAVTGAPDHRPSARAVRRSLRKVNTKKASRRPGRIPTISTRTHSMSGSMTSVP